MDNHLIAPVIYLVAMLVLVIQIVSSAFGWLLIEPVSAIILFLFFKELSKLLLAIKEKKEDV
jgi:hypothetical protein